jgi:hypothetical protein
MRSTAIREETMKLIRQLALMTLILATISSHALANSSVFVNMIGFSDSGKYFAIEEFGNSDDTNDDSDYSTIYIFNVAENRLAVPAFNANGRWYRKSTMPGERVYEKNVEKRLRKFGMTNGYIDYGITSGYLDETFGTDLRVVNLNTTYPEPGTINGEMLTDEMRFTANFGRLNMNREFDATLNKVLLPRENCSEFKRDMFSFELKIIHKNNTPLLLRNYGNGLKKSVCADACGIGRIAVYRNKVAVMVASFSKNSKGPKNRYVVVTGVLPAK